MTNKAKAEVIRRCIREKKLVLESMRERTRVLNQRIPILEQELKVERAELVEIEKLINPKKPVAGE